MPYGLPKKLGGDTAASTAWMERCISDVQAKGRSRLSSILICKAQWAKTQTKGRRS